jgi:hypothetical protein
LLASSGVEVSWILFSSGVPSPTVMYCAFASLRAIAFLCSLTSSLDVGPSKRRREVNSRMRWLTRPCRICGLWMSSLHAVLSLYRSRCQWRGISWSFRFSSIPVSNSRDWMLGK